MFVFFLWIIAYLLIGAVNFSLTSSRCSHELFSLYAVQNENDDDSSNVTSFHWAPVGDDSFTFLQNTYDCNANLNGHVSQALNHSLKFCNETDVEVTLYPLSVLPNGTNILPYVTLNITVTVFTPISEIFIQFRCLNAPDQEDKYCHDHSDQIRNWGRMIWPCRDLQITTDFNEDGAFDSNLSLPLRFSYDCFHLFGLSQYEVNVTIARWAEEPCRSTTYLAIPSYTQLEPKIRQFYRGGDNWLQFQNDWSPLAYVDMSYSDSVWIKFQPIAWVPLPKFVSVAVFERSVDGAATHFLLSERIATPNNGFKWENVAAGDYLIFVYVNRFDCQLNCGDESSAASDDSTCKICPHTVLNFTVLENKFSVSYQRSFTLMGFLKAVVIAVFVTLACVTIALAAVLAYIRFWRMKRMLRQPYQNIELEANPSLLILYTDDCEEHTNTVLALAELLKRDANVRVLIDQCAFNDPHIRPSIWLLNAISEAEFILLIFSECSTRVLYGETLIQRRPFPDLFNTAVGYVISKINVAVVDLATLRGIKKSADTIRSRKEQESTLLKTLFQPPSLSNRLKSLPAYNRFAVARFDYCSPAVIPDFFMQDVFGPFTLPQDLGRLVGRFHGITAGHAVSERESRFEHSANLDEVNQAMDEYRRFCVGRQDWMAERFETKIEENTLSSVKELLLAKDKNGDHCLEYCLHQIVPQAAEPPKSLAEQLDICEQRYGLERPTDKLLNDDNDSVGNIGSDDKIKRVDKEVSTSDEVNVDDYVDLGKESPKEGRPNFSFKLTGNLEDFCASSISLSSDESSSNGPLKKK